MSDPTPWAELAETHSAIVVFAGDRAYKLKKPVTFDFLDFSTRELREAAAHREVDLNRRISPDVYLGVSDVLDVDGSICDHLVVMRRLPSDRRLSALVTAGTVTDDDLRSLARLIAVFHSAAPRTEATAAAGSPEHLATKLELDLGELQRFRGSILDAATLDEVAARTPRATCAAEPACSRRACRGDGSATATATCSPTTSSAWPTAHGSWTAWTSPTSCGTATSSPTSRSSQWISNAWVRPTSPRCSCGATTSSPVSAIHRASSTTTSRSAP